MLTNMADQQLYDEGLRPSVVINWESFERRGIPPGWRSAFTGAVIQRVYALGECRRS